MDEMDDSSDHEARLEIIPNGSELVVAISLYPATTLLLRDRTEQIVQVAKTILAAECAWMPAELVNFARDIVGFKATKVLPIETDPRSLDVEIRSEADYEQAMKAREAMKELSSFLRVVFKDAFARLEQQARDWSEGRGVTLDRIQ